eukprot:CAMPEP_0197539402 /NCGR_PEP_ID=MMETSP1318-20131121/62598_1 /TAXON_ID=552666 /ORGANISM="Partenskyella glossopodia, Strain RCC365" /LENGTH=415 /DNA_ID=CAMNT_0043098111 /DNA_START=73 /DNA_END=1320 /DNA_ORIENTATION=-
MNVVGTKAPIQGQKKQKGKRIVGRAPRKQSTTSSIPSKFETILFLGQKEAKGFSSGATRFKEPINHDVPGPGAYKPEMVLRTSQSRESFSRKGYGNLASKTGRFNSDRPTYYPGPGQNNPRYSKQSIYSNRSPSYRNCFSRNAPRFPSKKMGDTLGPGHYDVPLQMKTVYEYRHPSFAKQVEDTRTAAVFGDDVPVIPKFTQQVKDMPIRRAAFGVCQKRFIPKKVPVAPEPGTYMPQVAEVNRPAARNAFSSKSKRELNTTKTPKDIMFHSRPDTFPGPGKYKKLETWFTEKMAKPTHNFVDRDDDRFGNPKERKSKQSLKKDWPGPGAYNPTKRQRAQTSYPSVHSSWYSRIRMNKSKKKKKENGSYFFETKQSRVAINDHISMAPGPAYYKKDEIILLRKTSHLVNRKKRWI